MSFKAQFGTAEESTWGTGVTVDRFHEILAGETLQRRQSVIATQGLRPGTRHQRGASRVLTRNDAGGSVQFEVMDQGFGRFLKHMLGAVATTQPDAANSPTVYAHTFTPGDLSGKSLTLQKGIEKTDGTVQAFTYHGAKIPSWSFSIDNDGILQLDLEFDAKEEVTSTALAVWSVPTLVPFHFAQGTLKVAASTIATVSAATMAGQNALKTDRYFLGQSGTKLEQRENEYRGASGELTAEFENLTDFYDRFKADTSAVLELQFVGALISDNEYTQLTITHKDVRFTGETPQIGGPDVPEVTVPWEAFEDASGDSVEIVLQNTETTP